MAGLVTWMRRLKPNGSPSPLIAALAHYQFVTIHPYYDGNGRTARLLATFLLQRDGYGLTASSRSKRSTPGTSPLITSRSPSIRTTTTTKAATRPT